MAIDAKRFSLIHVPVEIRVMDDAGETVKETLNVWIRPISPAIRAEWAARGAIEKQRQAAEPASEGGQAEDPDAIADGAMEGVTTVLSDLIVKWDITDGGEPVKPTLEFLRTLDDGVLMAIYTAIQGRHNTSPNLTT